VHNPFKYGEVAIGDTFCNRKGEIKRLHQAFKDGQNIILISPRRWGKSSLVDESIRRFHQRAIIVTVDCFGIRSVDEFVVRLMKLVLRASASKLQEILALSKEFLRTISPFISISTGIDNEINIGLNLSNQDLNIDEALGLPQKIAISKKIPLVICIDEFQMISEWHDGDQFLNLLRSKWQKHPAVTYCLYGSKRSLMESLFSNSSKPFYRFGETIFLERIMMEDWIDFLISKFNTTGKNILPADAEYLVDKVDRQSYFIQYLSRIAWNNSKQRINKPIIENAFNQLLIDHHNVFVKQTERLTKYKVNYIKAFIAGETKFTSQRVLKDYDLGSPGNIKRIETSLYDSEIIDFYPSDPEFFDPYFEPLFRKVFLN
jgi:hypothetical protein